MNLNTIILALVVGKANKSEKMYVMIYDVLHLGCILKKGGGKPNKTPSLN
jgi:hypothetical protein